MGGLVIGWVGNYRRVDKRFDIAVKYCNDYGHTICIAGPPKTKLHYPHSEMPNYYRNIDLLLVTSIKEAHPLAVYECLSCGTPVAMLDVGDCKSEGLGGISYYTYLDSEVIDDCVKGIMENKMQLGMAGRKSILKRWQWEHWIPSYVKMFQNVSRKKQGIRLVITVDKPGWAWDIMARILVEKLTRTKYFNAVHIAYTRGVDWSKVLHINKLKTSQYDVILNHTWQAYNHKTHGDFPHEKNIPCANGDAYKSKGWIKTFNEIANQAVAITTVSKLIASDLRSKFNKDIYHCSRGVETDLFKP
jgi:glycosyltransferase involved in cell wall biosynthesis